MKIFQDIQQNNLKLIKSNIFNKDHIFIIEDISGEKMILKTDRISPAQVELLKIAEEMSEEVCFKVPQIIIKEGDFIAIEYIEGKNLNEHCENIDDYLRVSKNIADDYQKISSRFSAQNGLVLGGKAQAAKAGERDDLLESGEKWLFKKLQEWSRPIVDEGLIEESRTDELRELFKRIIKQKGESFFGWAHGNIIGDHIIVNQKGEYLLDLEILPRPGKNYYDFLRALDWIFLKSDRLRFDDVVCYIKKYLCEFEWDEAMLVFAFRCIGILGCDMLKNGDFGKGDIEQKKKDLIRFIKMEF